MLDFFKKLLFLGEVLFGVVAVAMIFSPMPHPFVLEAVMLALGIFLVFDGLERLDGPEHGPY